MRASPADEFVLVRQSCLAVVRSCKLCKFFDVRKLGARMGRGEGFREGNRQRGRLIQHVKTAHPAEYAAAYATWKALNAKCGEQS